MAATNDSLEFCDLFLEKGAQWNRTGGYDDTQPAWWISTIETMSYAISTGLTRIIRNCDYVNCRLSTNKIAYMRLIPELMKIGYTITFSQLRLAIRHGNDNALAMVPFIADLNMINNHGYSAWYTEHNPYVFSLIARLPGYVIKPQSERQRRKAWVALRMLALCCTDEWPCDTLKPISGIGQGRDGDHVAKRLIRNYLLEFERLS